MTHYLRALAARLRGLFGDQSLFTLLTLIALLATNYLAQEITRKIDEYMIAAVKALSLPIIFARNARVLRRVATARI